jgi:hypothetical protein
MTMTTEAAKTAEEKVVLDERPIFRVQQAGGFATGLKKYEPGEDVVWEVPEGWNAARNGKHFASHGPSMTFLPMNPPAERIMEKHRKLVAERNRPKPTADDERAQKLEKLVLDLLNSQGEAQAESRRQAAQHAELMERLIAVQEKGNKK